MAWQPCSATMARWIKTVLSKAGIDTSIFKVHLVRGAATSAAAEADVSIPKILEAADWLSQSTFEHFYFHPNKSSSFGTTVLKYPSISTCKGDIERRNTPKYN